jgi:predicted amidohydrolase
MLKASRLNVAVAQIDCVLGNVKANARKHLEFIEETRDAGVEMLLCPELSLTGDRLGADIIQVALNREDQVIREIAQAVPEMTVILGFVEEGPGAQFYNSAIALHQGKLAFLHRKLNLPTYGNLEEGKLFANGRYVEIFEINKPWVAGVLICADLWNPALVHLAMVPGATLLLAPVNSAVEAVSSEFSNPKGWELTVHFYAMIYGMPILMANRIGTEGGARFWGGSQIVDPYGSTLVQADTESECLIQATLDYNDVRHARFQLPTVRDSNLNLVHREIERLATEVGIPTFIRGT